MFDDISMRDEGSKLHQLHQPNKDHETTIVCLTCKLTFITPWKLFERTICHNKIYKSKEYLIYNISNHKSSAITKIGIDSALNCSFPRVHLKKSKSRGLAATSIYLNGPIEPIFIVNEKS